MFYRPRLSLYAAIIPAAWLAFATPSLAVSPAVTCSSLASPGLFTDTLKRGYAGTQTDIGHTNADGAGWALIAPGVPNTDRITDYSWRAVRLMTTVGKAIVNRYYAQGPAILLLAGLLARRPGRHDG